MHTILKFSLMFLIILLASPIWGSEEQPDQISQRWSSWFSTQERQTSAKPAATPVYQANLTQTFSPLPVDPASVRDLLADADRPRTQGILASTTWLKGAFSTETEVANNQGGTVSLQNRIPGDTRDDPSTRMMRLGLTGSSGPVRYGMTYRTAGQAFYNGPDQALREVWGEWKNGPTTFRSTIGQQWNNVDGDLTRSRIAQHYGQVGLSWNKPVWPNLAVTYSQNSLNSTLDPTGVAPQRMNNQTLEAAVGYNSIAWNARMASSYILETDLFRNGSDNRVKVQSVTASFRPVNTLTIAPTLSYRAEQQEWSGARIDSPSASFAMNYKQSQRLLISAMGNYSGMRSSDRLIDLQNVGGKGILAFDIQQSRDWTTLISLEAGYNRQINRVTPSAETEDISGLLRFVLADL